MTMTKIQHIMKEQIVTRANVLGDDEMYHITIPGLTTQFSTFKLDRMTRFSASIFA